MSTAKSFTVDKVSWHTGVKGNPESREAIIGRFKVVAKFLNDNNLTVIKLSNYDNIGDDFCIHSSDLTEEGICVMRMAYDKWLSKIDKGMDYNNVNVLELALRKLRQSTPTAGM